MLSDATGSERLLCGFSEFGLAGLTAVERLYGLRVDTGPLETFAAEVSRHYEELARQMREREAEQGSRDEDRMFMRPGPGRGGTTVPAAAWPPTGPPSDHVPRYRPPE